jgi:hypothetical protein
VPVRSSLCSGHYQKERRWRASADLADRSEPAA